MKNQLITESKDKQPVFIFFADNWSDYQIALIHGLQGFDQQYFKRTGDHQDIQMFEDLTHLVECSTLIADQHILCMAVINTPTGISMAVKKMKSHTQNIFAVVPSTSTIKEIPGCEIIRLDAGAIEKIGDTIASLFFNRALPVTRNKSA